MKMMSLKMINYQKYQIIKIIINKKNKNPKLTKKR